MYILMSGQPEKPELIKLVALTWEKNTQKTPFNSIIIIIIFTININNNYNNCIINNQQFQPLLSTTPA